MCCIIKYTTFLALLFEIYITFVKETNDSLFTDDVGRQSGRTE
jgi:hypothetical protein